MKKLLFKNFSLITLLIVSINVNATVLTLNIPDTIGSGEDAIFGRVSLFQVNTKYFKIGMFQFGIVDSPQFENDTITQNTVFAVYYVNDPKKQGSFRNNYNHSNSSRVSKCHYLYLEGELFNIKYIDSAHIEVSRTSDNINVSGLNYNEVLDCLYHISYLDFKLTDSTKNKAPIEKYFEKNKLNIIYCTMKGCALVKR